MNSSRESVLFYGHLCIDQNEIVGEKVAESPGSPAYFGAQIFNNFGVNPIIISSRGADYTNAWLNGIEVFPKKPQSKKTLVYKNVYDENGSRILYVENLEYASPIDPSTIPPELLSSVCATIVAPIANNIKLSQVKTLWQSLGSEKLFICLPQGFFRRFEQSGEVYQDVWEDAEEFVRHFDIICLSQEDGENIDEQAKLWSQIKPIVAVTRAQHGCSIYEKGTRTDYPAFEVETIADPVGAGDVFAAAFVYQFLKEKNIKRAATFANAAGALSLSFHPQQMQLNVKDIQNLALEGRSLKDGTF